MEHWYHIVTFAAIVLAYWLVRALAAGLEMPKRLLAAEGASQVLFAGIWLFLGIRYNWHWNIFLVLAPTAGLLASWLCFVVDGAVSLRKQKASAYYIGVGAFFVIPLLTLLLPPIRIVGLLRELIVWSFS